MYRDDFKLTLSIAADIKAADDFAHDNAFCDKIQQMIDKLEDDCDVVVHAHKITDHRAFTTENAVQGFPLYTAYMTAVEMRNTLPESSQVEITWITKDNMELAEGYRHLVDEKQLKLLKLHYRFPGIGSDDDPYKDILRKQFRGRNYSMFDIDEFVKFHSYANMTEVLITLAD